MKLFDTTDLKDEVDEYLNKVDITWEGIIITGREQAREFLINFINFIKD